MSEEWNVFQHAQPALEAALGWRTVPMLDSKDVHLIPIGDSHSHELSENCSCSPTVNEMESGGEIVLRDINHVAWDGRDHE